MSGKKTWQNTMKTSQYLSHERQNTHAVVTQDAVRHLVTCSNKALMFFLPQKQHLIFIKAKIRPAGSNQQEIEYTRTAVLHLLEQVCKPRFSNTCKLHLPDAARGESTRHRDHPLPRAHME